MDSSKLNRRITIQEYKGGTDDAGFPTPPVWMDIVTLWADREPLSGKEFFAAAAVQAENTVRFRIRYRKGINTKMRILHDGFTYEIYAVLDDVRGDRTETHIMTKQKV